MYCIMISNKNKNSYKNNEYKSLHVYAYYLLNV
jgi:hypothetical protein